MTYSAPHRFLRAAMASALVLAAGVSIAAAQQAAPPPAPGAPPPAPAAPAAPSQPLTSPSMAGPLALNPTPLKFDTGPLGVWYGTGVLSGFGMVQTNSFPTDHNGEFDITNGQAIVQKIDGLVQFYAEAGIYSFPAIGLPYIRATTTNSEFFGPLPVAYLKLAPNSAFNVQAGKLPTLIGAEYSFTFQNMNIERGLLWNQEPIVSKGVQANYTAGPVALSLSLNDGFDSDRYNWLVGSGTWTINPANSLALVVGGNAGRTTLSTVATPPPQSNSTIVNLIYTYNKAPWTITPYFQYTSVPKNVTLYPGSGADTWGFAVLANYAFNDNFNLSGRFEAIGSGGSTNVLYGPGSNAFSFTLTPTYTLSRFFVRADGSLVTAGSTTPGFVFGKTGTATTQARFMLETGVLF
jgi:hypothetical protein